MRVCAAVLLPLTGMVAAGPATAQRLTLDLPAGPLGVAIDALAKQGGVSVALSDRALWTRYVPALRGRMSAEEALRILARRARADATRLGAAGWRLSPQRAVPVPAKPVAKDPLPSEAPPAGDVVVLASKRAARFATLAGSAEIMAMPRLGIDAGDAALVMRSTLLSSSYRGPGRDKLFVGGIADSGFPSRRQSVTGMYFGDVRLTYGSSRPELQLYDIASVEVLQGPQGTLYGSGSLGGVIRYNPNMPLRGVAEGSAEIGASTIARGAAGGDAHAIVNLPLGKAVAARAVAYVRSDGGFIDKPALGTDFNRTRIAGGRAAVRWWVADDWTVDATGIGQSIRNRDAQYATIGAPPLTDFGTVAEPSSSDYRAGHLVVTGRIGDLDLVSATGLSWHNGREDYAIPEDIGISTIVRRENIISHETRLSRGGDDGWVAGIAYAGSRGSSDMSTSHLIVAPLRSEASIDEWAVFGEGSVRLSSFLSLGAGVRGVHAVSRARRSRPGLFADIFVEPRRSEKWLLPSASVRLRPADHWLAYVRYQQGRRAEVSPTEGIVEARENSPREVLGMIDGGVRWTGERWRASASVQHSRWNGARFDVMESLLELTSLELGDWSLLSANADVSGPIVAGLRIDGAVSVNTARQVDRSLEFVEHAHLPDIPEVIARVAVNWTVAAGRDAVVRIDAWTRYNGRSWAVLGPIQIDRQGDYTQTGLTIDMQRKRDGATLSIDNLVDQRGRRYVFGGGWRIVNTETPLRPLTIRLSYRRHF